MIDKITKTFIAWIICQTIENIAMIAGIIFAAVHFNRFSLLWFLLIPAINQITHIKQSSSVGKENDNGRLQ